MPILRRSMSSWFFRVESMRRMKGLSQACSLMLHGLLAVIGSRIFIEIILPPYIRQKLAHQPCPLVSVLHLAL